jgi:hypothetical protein
MVEAVRNNEVVFYEDQHQWDDTNTALKAAVIVFFNSKSGVLSLKFRPQMVTGIQHLHIAMSPPMDQNYQKIISKRSKTIQPIIKSRCVACTHMRHLEMQEKPRTPENDAFMRLVDLPPTFGSSSKLI